MGWYVDVNQDEATGDITNLTAPAEVVTRSLDESGTSQTITENLAATMLVDEDGNLQNVSKSVGGRLLYESSGGKLYFYKALDDLTVYAQW